MENHGKEYKPCLKVSYINIVVTVGLMWKETSSKLRHKCWKTGAGRRNLFIACQPITKVRLFSEESEQDRTWNTLLIKNVRFLNLD